MKKILISDDVSSNRDLAGLLLLDLKMPLIDGWEVCRVIREELKSLIPIIIISSKDKNIDYVKKYNIQNFITLPYNHEILINSVNKALS